MCFFPSILMGIGLSGSSFSASSSATKKLSISDSHWFRLPERDRFYAARTAASSFFMSSRSASTFSNRWP